MLTFLRKYSFLLLLLCCLAAVPGCVDDTEPNPRPTITFTPQQPRKSLWPGDSVKDLSIAVNAADNLQSFTITKAGESQPMLHLPDLQRRNFQTRLRDKVDSSAKEGGVIIYQFTAVTTRNETTTRNYIIDITRTATFANVTLGNQNNSGTGGFFSAKDGKVFTAAAADTNAAAIDLVFYHSAPGANALSEHGATITAPADSSARQAYPRIANWSQRNATRFKLQPTYTLTDFNNANTGSQLMAAFGSGAGTSSLRNLSNNQVFSFRTAGGQYGIARITRLTAPSVTSPSGSIRLDIRVQR